MKKSKNNIITHTVYQSYLTYPHLRSIQLVMNKKNKKTEQMHAFENEKIFIRVIIILLLIHYLDINKDKIIREKCGKLKYRNKQRKSVSSFFLFYLVNIIVFRFLRLNISFFPPIDRNIFALNNRKT